MRLHRARDKEAGRAEVAPVGLHHLAKLLPQAHLYQDRVEQRLVGGRQKRHVTRGVERHGLPLLVLLGFLVFLFFGHFISGTSSPDFPRRFAALDSSPVGLPSLKRPQEQWRRAQ